MVTLTDEEYQRLSDLIVDAGTEADLSAEPIITKGESQMIRGMLYTNMCTIQACMKEALQIIAVASRR